jgi:general secretion pathway protein A
VYTEFYGLIERPFELTPDQRYLYLSAHHREALAHLTYGVEERKGFVQLTGEVGTGKTTMLDALVVGLDASTKVARLAHTTIDEIDLLRILARGFGVELQGVKKSDMLAELGETLGEWTKQGRNAVFIVDEAQNLSLQVLEEIRLLSNLRANGRSSLQIVLAGQPELRAKLERRELRQLRQRIGIRYHLTPLSREETGEYIEHRLKVAGAPGKIFDRSAVQAVYEYSRGVPRVINTICDRALLAGYAEGRRQIGREPVLATIEAIEGRAPVDSPSVVSLEREPTPPRPERGRRRWIVPVLTVAATVVVTALLAWHTLGWRPAALGARRPEAPASGAVEPVHGGDSARAAGDREADPAAPAQERPADEDDPAADADAPAELGEAPGGEPPTGRAEGDPEAATDAVPGTSTAPPPPGGAVAEEPAGGRTVGPGGPYAVVVASSRREDTARDVVARLERRGFGAAVERAELPSGLWYRAVLEGGYPTIGAARDVAELVGDIGDGEPWVLKR